jgi:Lysyl oxidase
MQPRTRHRLLATGLGVAAVALASALMAAGMGGEPPAAPAAEPSDNSPRVLDRPPMPSAPADSALLPNLRSLPAEDVIIRIENGNRVLRFAGILANVGVGPLELSPRGSATCPTDHHPADQRIYQDGNGDGRYRLSTDRRRATRSAGCMLSHPTHDHWHFDAMAGYALRRPGDHEPVVSKNKVSFCLRDNRRVAGMPASTPRRYGDCEERLDLQGISSGWADVYGNDLGGQVLNIPDRLPGGVYCLRTVADPDGLIRESDEADNAAALAIRITGSDVRTAPASSCR